MKMHQKRLAAGFRPDPLGELIALPDPWLYLRLRGSERERWRKTGGVETKGRGQEGKRG